MLPAPRINDVLHRVTFAAGWESPRSQVLGRLVSGLHFPLTGGTTNRAAGSCADFDQAAQLNLADTALRLARKSGAGYAEDDNKWPAVRQSQRHRCRTYGRVLLIAI